MKQVMPGVWATQQQARDVLNQQPFTKALRARHVVVPVFERNLLGEKVSERPIGWCYRLRAAGEV